MVFLEAFGVQHQIDGLPGLCQRGIPARLRFHAGGGDIGERAVNVVNGGEGGHGRDQMALRDRDGHAVVGGAGVGHHAMLVIHKDGDSRGVDLVALRRAVLNEVVLALGEHAIFCGRELRLAVFVGRDGVIGGCAPDDRPSGVGDEQIILLVEGEGHAVDWIVVVVELLHVEVVLDVGDIDGGGKLTLEVFAVDPIGVPLIGLRKLACRGVIERDGVGCVLLVTAVDPFSGPVIIFSEIAGAVLELGHVSAVGRELERDGVAIVCRASSQSPDHGLTIARLTGPALIYPPAGQCAAGDNAPFICGGRLTLADVVQTAHDDGEELAAGGKMGLAVCGDQLMAVLIGDCGSRHVIAAVRVDELDAFAGGDSALETGVGAGGPAVLHIIEKDGYRVVARQHEIDVLVAAIAFAALWPLLQDQVFNVMLVCQLVEADVSAGVVVEDEAAAAVGRAGGQKAIGALGVVDDVTLAGGRVRVFRGGIEVKFHAVQAGAELVDLDAVGLGDVGEVKLHREVRIRAAALEIEELQRVIGVVGKGILVPIAGIVIAVFGHDALQRADFLSVDNDIAADKVDGRCGLIVDAAEVGHEDAVDEDPDVVVTRKLEGHGAGVMLVTCLAAVALDKARGHGHPEIVVDGVAVRADGGLCQGIISVEREDGLRVGEGEELAHDTRASAACDSPVVVEREGFRHFIEVGIVRAFIFVLADIALVGIVVVIAVFANAQETRNIPEGLLVGCCAAISTILVRFIEQIGQRLRCGCIRRLFCTVCFAGSQDGIAAGKPILNDAGKRGLGAGPLVDVCAGTALVGACADEF